MNPIIPPVITKKNAICRVGEFGNLILHFGMIISEDFELPEEVTMVQIILNPEIRADDTYSTYIVDKPPGVNSHPKTFSTLLDFCAMKGIPVVYIKRVEKNKTPYKYSSEKIWIEVEK